MELRIKNISEKTFGLTIEGVNYVFPANFRASAEGNVITVKDNRVSFSVNMDYDSVFVDDDAFTDVEAAVDAINQAVFKLGGGVSYTTLDDFEAYKHYVTGEAIVHDGEIWVAKSNFMAGADFDADDWEQVSVGTEELSEELDKKLDKVATENKLYGTDELGEQEEYNVSYFEKSENKTDTIRDIDEADDVKFPTEKATRTELNKKADKIVTPHIDWNPDSFNVSAGRTLQFNEATTPTIAGEDMPIVAYYSAINGNPDSMFGFFSNDGGATTQFGKFHLNNDASAFVADVLLYDGTTWLNGGHYVLSDDIAGDFDSFIGNNVTVAGFDLATDITVLDVPDKNLIDIENEILQLVISKANIYVRLAQGITTGNNIQGMHIAPKPPFAYFTDWTLTASDGATIVRTDNSLIYNKSNGSVVTLVDSGNILISDYVLEDVFLITEMTGSFTNVNLFYRYFDLKDYDQRIGLLSALQTVDKSSIVNAINSLKSYVDGILSSSEVAGSPYTSYADFMTGAGATITPSKYAYVTFTATDTHPSGGNWDKIVAGETWRLDCSDTAWLPTSNMTAAMTSNVLDESATNALKAAGSDTVTSWLQSFRNNLKSLFASITSLSNDKQDKLTSTGSTNVLTAPATAGGQPGTKAIADFATPSQVDAKQNKITATGATNLLVAPTEAGGQPGTKAITDFATPSQVAAKQDKLPAIPAGRPKMFYLPGDSPAGTTPLTVAMESFAMWYSIVSGGSFVADMNTLFRQENNQKQSLLGRILGAKTDLPSMTYPAVWTAILTTGYTEVTGTIIDANIEQWNFRITGMGTGEQAFTITNIKSGIIFGKPTPVVLPAANVIIQPETSSNLTTLPTFEISMSAVNSGTYTIKHPVNCYLLGIIKSISNVEYFNIIKLSTGDTVKQYLPDGTVGGTVITIENEAIQLSNNAGATCLAVHVANSGSSAAWEWIYSLQETATFRLLADPSCFPLVLMDQYHVHIPMDRFRLHNNLIYPKTLKYNSPQSYALV